MSTAIFYGSSTGNTEAVAKQIAKNLGDIEAFDISSKSIEEVCNYEKLILGVSTWGEGDLQDDWDEEWETFKDLDLKDKTIALFGLGDQESYADEFVDALGTIYEVLNEQGANIIGKTTIEGYDYEESKAEVDGQFVGLVIDEDNQDELTEDRINNWVKDIKNEIL